MSNEMPTHSAWIGARVKHARDCYLPPRIEQAIEDAEVESQKHADLAAALRVLLDEQEARADAV